MHRLFHDRLDQARGESRNVVAVFFDIRGFTTFNTKVDAVDSAAYIKRVYQRVLDKYFSGASFFKPTGDGLMIIYDHDAETVQQTLRSVVDACVRLGAKFREITAGDPMINFAVPDKAGFGISRGSACCLISGTRILDYSGRQLNLAARLLDLARPEGIVMDGAVGLEPLETDKQALFDTTSAVVRGISERTPGIPVFFTKGLTNIPPSAHQSIDQGPLVIKRHAFKSVREMEEAGNLRVVLDTRPRNPATIQVTSEHPVVGRGGGRHPTLWHYHRLSATDFLYREPGGRPSVILNCPAIVKAMRERKVKLSWPAAIQIEYEGA